ncbi:hypothetical protein [Parathermosynechococcus lividus]|nr:hypothetical protein [Thermostichus lividus]
MHRLLTYHSDGAIANLGPLELPVRHLCQCGTVLDRDPNAAISIVELG